MDKAIFIMDPNVKSSLVYCLPLTYNYRTLGAAKRFTSNDREPPPLPPFSKRLIYIAGFVCILLITHCHMDGMLMFSSKRNVTLS